MGAGELLLCDAGQQYYATQNQSFLHNSEVAIRHEDSMWSPQVEIFALL
jgi:hypothetical protein